MLHNCLSSDEGVNGWYQTIVYDTVIRSNCLLGIGSRRWQGGEPDLEFELFGNAPAVGSGPDMSMLYESRAKLSDGRPNLTIFQMQDGFRLSFPDFADFHLRNSKICCYSQVDQLDKIAECLLGPVLALWLEINDKPVLHAAAVLIGKHLVGFAGSSGMGKSTTVAALIQHGGSLFTDDCLVLRIKRGQVFAHAGMPQMRLHSTVAYRFGLLNRFVIADDSTEKGTVTVDSLSNNLDRSHAQRLDVLYVLQPVMNGNAQRDIEISEISNQDAFLALVQNTFLAGPIAALGLMPRRTAQWAEIVNCVPIRRLRLPRNLEQLDYAYPMIVADIQNVVGS